MTRPISSWTEQPDNAPRPSESEQQDTAAPPGVADVERILGGSTPAYTISDSTAAPAEALTPRTIGFNEFLGEVQGRLIKAGYDPGRWPDPTIRDTGDLEEALQSCVQWCAAALDRETPSFEAPDLTHMSNLDLVVLMGQCGRSDDPSDKAFAKACRDELARRKPSPSGDHGEQGGTK